jgi:adenylosuccinate synthase
MANIVIVGMQWGDEGKGKIVDLLCPAFDVVVRYQGGHNAGHTVKFEDRHFALRLIPSGVLHADTQCVLGNGMVIDPAALFSELEQLAAAGVAHAGRLWISERAHALLPLHVDLDKSREAALGDRKIGTTSRGIGPAYETKASRLGLRLADLGASDLEPRLEILLRRSAAELGVASDDVGARAAVLAAQCRAWAAQLAPMLRNTTYLINGWIAEGRSVLFEGAQGTLLDLDHGTFPFVTSSSSTAGGACTGTGVPPTALAGAIGVVKAYTTRVGGGPFLTEIAGEQGEALRKRGNEYGTVTGRPRRVGWLDIVAVRYARMINGIGSMALTKLDVLDDLAEIPVCTGYRLRGELVKELPACLSTMDEMQPVYRVMKGWRQPTVGALDFAGLPAAARDYLRFIEDEVEAPISLVSTGPRREETIVLEEPTLGRYIAGRREAVLRGI